MDIVFNTAQFTLVQGAHYPIVNYTDYQLTK
jgi:hypothetical protein